MGIQLIIVIIIGVAVAALIVRNLYRFFFIDKKKDYCGSCTGCSLSKKWTKEEEHDPYRAHLK